MFFYACGNSETVETPVSSDPTPFDPISSDNLPETNLALPFEVNNLNLSTALINPFGIIRHSKDNDIGHGGIDIPLVSGSPIYAVRNGIIIDVQTPTDGKPGSNIQLLLDVTAPGDTGWIFIYEHIALESGVGLNSEVVNGQKIATVPSGLTGTNHLQLTFLENTFFLNHQCWPNFLDSSTFQEQFDKDIRNRADFISAWQTTVDEGQYPFKGLLDTATFPEGAQLCYTLGTDVRTPAT